MGPQNINGSSSFCKGPRTSKVWKTKDPKGPRTLRLCMSEDLCKNYYYHLNFAVVTFLQKFKIGGIKQTKILSKHNCQKNLDGKNYYCPKNLDGKNHYHPRIWLTIQKVGSSRISFSLFLLIRFWILVRKVHLISAPDPPGRKWMYQTVAKVLLSQFIFSNQVV